MNQTTTHENVPTDQLAEQLQGFNVPIVMDDVDKASMIVIKFFNQAARFFSVDGGKLAILNRLSIILPFQPVVGDCLFKTKNIYSEKFFDLTSEETKIDNNITEILSGMTDYQDLLAKKKKIGFIKKQIQETGLMIDDYLVRSIVNEKGVIATPSGRSVKLDKTPPKMIIEDINKVPKQYIETIKNISTAQKKKLKEDLIAEEKLIDAFEATPVKDRKEKGIKNIPLSKRIKGAKLERNFKLGGEIGGIKIK